MNVLPHRIRGKIGVVGMGMVGSSFAYSLMQSGLANEMVLIDLDHGRAEGEAMDLNHGLPFVGAMRIQAGTYDDLAQADIVVLTAGASQRPGQTRLDLLQKNAGIFRDIVPKVVAANPNGVILIATNPVDILTQIAHEMAGLPWGRVIGSGTILDTARFRFLLGQEFGVDPRSIHASIIAEHGDSAVAVWSGATIGGIPLADVVGPKSHRVDQATLDQIFDQTIHAAYEIIQRKTSTYYAIGLGLVAIVKAILRDQKTIQTVSTPMLGAHRVEGIALSLPTIIGHHGAEHLFEIPLNAGEKAAFQKSAAVLKQRMKELDGAGRD